MDSCMLISPLLSCFLGMHRQSTSAIGCKLLYIVIILLVFLFIASNSSFLQLIIPAVLFLLLFSDFHSL